MKNEVKIKKKNNAQKSTIVVGFYDDVCIVLHVKTDWPVDLKLNK